MKRRDWVRPTVFAASILVVLLLALARFDVRLPGARLPTQFAFGRRQSDQFLLPRLPPVEPSDPDGYAPPEPAADLTIDPSMLWGRRFMLDGSGLERGVSFGDSSRLRRQVERMMKGEHVRLTAVGASITSGAGGLTWPLTRTNWPGYVSQFEDWLRAAFPKSSPAIHNSGMAGTFSGVFAQCYDTLIPPADIYILEQTTFDGTEPEKCYCKKHYVDTPVQMGIERLIRRMLKQPWKPAVVLVNAYGFRFPNFGTFQRSVENQVIVMGQYYGLPVASLRSAAFRHMLEGGNGFDVTTSVKLYGNDSLPADNYPFYFDQVHPWGPTGHRVLADLLVRMVQATVVGLNVQPLAAEERSPPDQALMPPMHTNNYETNTSSCWLGDDFRDLIRKKDLDGFEWINDRPEATERKAQKWGYVATKPGSSLEFTVDTRVNSAAGDEPNRVVLSYLASYEYMGTARVECVSGCECERTIIDALWEERASMLMTQEFKATQHAKCRIRITVRDSTSGDGHRFKLAGVMVLPAGTNEFSSTDRLDVVVPQMFGQ